MSHLFRPNDKLIAITKGEHGRNISLIEYPVRVMSRLPGERLRYEVLLRVLLYEDELQRKER